MGKSSETFSKKEKEKKKLKKRKEKEEKMDERKANPNKGLELEEMMAYVDEDGNISSTPPDPKKKRAFNKEDIEVGVSRRIDEAPDNSPRTGTVTFFNESKGYGFIKDSKTGDSVFVHLKGVLQPIREGDKVTFEVEKTPKGLGAIAVKKN
jgi:cold shock CspA family protein